MQEYERLFIRYLLRSQNMEYTKENFDNIWIDTKCINLIYEDNRLFIILYDEIGCEHTLNVLYKDEEEDVQELIL